ncbi:hypothetical protein EW145_g4694 [Phellinidium pouzarii]|uniref:Endocytosis protein 3 n=1 Tax=Phellinidium pouzarii TaxID=167371 RepID=A0A4V3XCE7_9AGAM|nr:hypothetical protein EW145_g4694 [Phellinidium pouzarii]
MSSFAPTQPELALVNKVFATADSSKLGIVTGDAAVKIFAGAKLPPTVLGEIWSIADKDNNGFLTKKGVAIALRLIGLAQKGEPVNESLLDRPGPLAHIEGISPVSRSSSIPSSPTPNSPPRGALSPLTAEDKTKFLRLFLGCGPVNGLLNGDKARDVFVKSKLSVEKSLADTQDRGSLDQTDFTVAMYLIQAIMSGQMTNPPATLPPSLYEQAGGRNPAGVATHGTGNSVTLTPSLTGSFAAAISNTAPLTAQTTGGARARLQPQITGQDYNRLSMAIPPSQHVHFAPNPVAALGATAFGNATAQPWDVTAEEKTRFDQFFVNLDTLKRGFIEGDVAVPFMLQSKLSEDILAQVWDLADLNNDGRLTREGFAVAMHLIQGKLVGKDIPSTLPISLIPPAMRTGHIPGSAPAPAPIPEPMRDLLWDDSPPASATAPQHPGSPLSQATSVQSTSTLQPQMTGQFPQTQHTEVSFLGTLPAPASSTGQFGTSAFAPSGNRDFLSDDEAAPATVPDNSAEIGNLKNQISSTNRSLETTKVERQSVETALATQASQLSALQTQLSSSKAAYETETRLLTTLRERELSGVRVEKAGVEGNVLRDKEEVRDLQRKMKNVGDEVEQMKAALEKAKKETKHQKGLLAIAKKQLATRETERAKVAKELEEAELEAQESTQERKAAEEELAKEPPPAQTNGVSSPSLVAASELSRTDTPSFAATQPLPASPMTPPSSVGSLPSTKTNNPFERLVMASTGSRPASPFLAPAADLFLVPTPQLQSEVPHAESTSSAPTAFSTINANAEVPQTSSPFRFSAEPSTSTTAPSTHSATATDIDDPFGLSEGEKLSSTTSVAATPEKPATPQPTAAFEREETKTPPPVIAETSDISTSVLEEPSSKLDFAAAQFPPIDNHVESKISSFEGSTEGSTDLNAKLVEKEDEGSDSDSDNESEFHDAKEARPSLGGPVDEHAKHADVMPVPETEIASNESSIHPVATSAAFGDAFGLGESTPKAETHVHGLPPSSDYMSDLFSMPISKPVDGSMNGKAPEQNSTFANVTTGVNAFDEAMGKISSPSTSSTAPQFKLDSAFDDNFDFSAAKAEGEPYSSSFPPAPSSIIPAANGTFNPAKASLDFGSPFTPATQTNTQENDNSFSFEDAFSSVSSSHLSSLPSVGDHGISFEDAFNGEALALDGAHGASTAAANTTAAPKQMESRTGPFPVQSPTRSPSLGAMPASPSTIRSVRSVSPPPRFSSPKPRVSTGSSNEGTTTFNKSPPPARRSGLSIRLPFGRKDKKKSKHDPPSMPPPQFLSPVAEPGANTPAVEDDVEPVKQLCGMGFSRTQAVAALEKHGYDVQRSLNSLLGGA